MEMLEMMSLGFAEEDRIHTKEEPLTLTEEFFVSLTWNLAERGNTDPTTFPSDEKVASPATCGRCPCRSGARRYRTFLVCSEEVRDFR